MIVVDCLKLIFYSIIAIVLLVALVGLLVVREEDREESKEESRDESRVVIKVEKVDVDTDTNALNEAAGEVKWIGRENKEIELGKIERDKERKKRNMQEVLDKVAMSTSTRRSIEQHIKNFDTSSGHL